MSRIGRGAQEGVVVKVYIFGAEAEQTNLQVVRGLLAALDKSDELNWSVEDRAGRDRRYAIDSSKAQRELGWMCRFGFEEGLTRPWRGTGNDPHLPKSNHR